MIINYRGIKCTVKFAQYINGNTAMFLEDADTSEPIITVSVNPDIELDESTMAIKNYSENEGVVEELLLENVIVGESIISIPSGFIEIPVYKLSDKTLEALEASKNEQ